MGPFTDENLLNDHQCIKDHLMSVSLGCLISHTGSVHSYHQIFFTLWFHMVILYS